MTIQFYNTLNRRLEDFTPIKDKHVGIYACGPTVYNYAHIGNLRTYVFEDVLRRTLNYLGYKVNHVMNVTDVGHLTDDGDTGEDKMLRSAREKGMSVWEIAEFFTKAFFEDTDKLNIQRPETVCRATDHIEDMINLIKKIEANGYTYSAGGNLYFSVKDFERYGEMALLDKQDLQAGARIEIDKNKKHPADFVLWFTNSKFEHQAMMWDSPWGRGYPGWHIECSAMSQRYLGDQFDIHCGGIDHIPVHHTNEIAQSEAATGKSPWVRYWLHGEFLIMNRGKMSKSKGGFITLKVLEDAGYHPLDYRFFCLGAHYKSQLQFSYEALDSAKSARKNLLERIGRINRDGFEAENTGSVGEQEKVVLEEFKAHIAADLNMPRALADLWGVIKSEKLNDGEKLRLIFEMDKILGLDLLTASKNEAVADQELVKEIEALIAERASAKKEKNFARADEIRDNLASRGIILEDTPEGTRWKV